MLYIGIDLGTSAVKLILMDEMGQIHNMISRDYPINYPRPGWSEQNPEDWLRETLAGIQQLTQNCDKTQVAGIGAGGQMHGLVALDKNDRVLRPAILWNDGRTGEETAWLNEVIGREKLSAYTANIAFAGFTAPKLLWMKSHEPTLFSQIDKIMLPKDYINYKLTGVHCTDYSDASGMLLLDVKNKCWSSEMLTLCGVPQSWMPHLYNSYETVGTLTAPMADLLGLPKTVKVAAGAGDNAAAAVGTGAVGAGRCNISIGTSGTIFISNDQFGVDPHNAMHSFAHADGGYHLMGCILSAASCNTWWQNAIIGTSDYKGEEAKIPKELLGKNSVYFLPYLMGERSPHNDAGARAAFLGMTMDTTRPAMTLAMLEGVAFAIRDSLEVARSLGVAPARSTICGGGAKSALWREIFANVLNMELDSVETEEGPGYGGAMLAAVACGQFETVAQAARQLVRVKATTTPTPALAEQYEARYQVFHQLYPALKPLFPAMTV